MAWIGVNQYLSLVEGNKGMANKREKYWRQHPILRYRKVSISFSRMGSIQDLKKAVQYSR